jgi:hypothetical protein
MVYKLVKLVIYLLFYRFNYCILLYLLFNKLINTLQKKKKSNFFKLLIIKL